MLDWTRLPKHRKDGFSFKNSAEHLKTSIISVRERLEHGSVWNNHTALKEERKTFTDRQMQNILHELGYEHRKKIKGAYYDAAQRPDMTFHCHQKHTPNVHTLRAETVGTTTQQQANK